MYSRLPRTTQLPRRHTQPRSPTSSITTSTTTTTRSSRPWTRTLPRRTTTTTSPSRCPPSPSQRSRRRRPRSPRPRRPRHRIRSRLPARMRLTTPTIVFRTDRANSSIDCLCNILCYHTCTLKFEKSTVGLSYLTERSCATLLCIPEPFRSIVAVQLLSLC